MKEILVLESDTVSKLKLYIECHTGLVELVDSKNQLLAEFWLPECVVNQLK